jgi:hypothetical protein
VAAPGAAKPERPALGPQVSDDAGWMNQLKRFVTFQILMFLQDVFICSRLITISLQIILLLRYCNLFKRSPCVSKVIGHSIMTTWFATDLLTTLHPDSS